MPVASGDRQDAHKVVRRQQKLLQVLTASMWMTDARGPVDCQVNGCVSNRSTPTSWVAPTRRSARPVWRPYSLTTRRRLLDQVTLQAMEAYLAATVGGDVCTSVEVAEAWLNRQEAVLA